MKPALSRNGDAPSPIGHPASLRDGPTRAPSDSWNVLLVHRSMHKVGKRKPRSGWVKPAAAQVEAAILLDGTPAPREFAPHAGCFRRRPWPSEGEWLDEHNETGQTVKSFARCMLKVRPSAHR